MAEYRVTLLVDGETDLSDLLVDGGNIEKITKINDTPETMEQSHNFEKGDYGRDKWEPTASPEANTVEVVELTNTPANEYETSEGKFVSEYSKNKFYENDSLVVGVRYPNMGGSDVWYMPEQRILPN